jgi:hypothetical protein
MVFDSPDEVACNPEGQPMTQRRSPLRMEELGARVLPSAAPLTPAPPSPHALISDAQAIVYHPLAGHGSGGWTADAIQSGAGITYTLQGTANLAALGKVQVSGWVRSVGFLQTGRAEGELTFTNSHGSVTVKLEGPQQPGFSALPQHFSYRIVSGTGAYKHLADHGSLHLALHEQPAGDLTGPHGTFELAVARSHRAHNPPAATGIEGVALVGPIAPVERPGVPNTRPMAGAIITVQPAGGGAEIARVRADSAGRFVLHLTPGRYLIVPLPPRSGQVLPRGIPETVVVPAGALTSVVVNYDSGIR